VNPGIKELNSSSFDEILKETDKLVIVEFYNTTCPNCQAISPVYEELSQELKQEAIFTRINTMQNTDIANRFGILSVPTFKFFCKDKPIGELVGALHATVIRNTIKDLIKHKNECIIKSTRLPFEMDGYG
jgi:thioredoxin